MPQHTPAEQAKNVADPGRPARLRAQGVTPPARPPLPTQAAPRATQALANRGPVNRGRNVTPQARRDALRRRLR